MTSTNIASRPSTPARVPKVAGTYSPAIVDAGLRSEINTLLLQGGHIIKIQEALLHALHASSANWPTVIHTHALSLLRSGECHTFPDLMSRVMADIKADTAAAQSQAQTSTPAQPTNGTGVNGKGGGSNKETSKGSGEGGQSLALPAPVVEEGLKITRECLEVVCEFQP